MLAQGTILTGIVLVIFAVFALQFTTDLCQFKVIPTYDWGKVKLKMFLVLTFVGYFQNGGFDG